MNKETTTMKATNYKKINNIYPCKIIPFSPLPSSPPFLFHPCHPFLSLPCHLLFPMFLFRHSFLCLLPSCCHLQPPRLPPSFLLFLPFLLLLEVLVLGCVDLVPFCLR